MDCLNVEQVFTAKRTAMPREMEARLTGRLQYAAIGDTVNVTARAGGQDRCEEDDRARK